MRSRRAAAMGALALAFVSGVAAVRPAMREGAAELERLGAELAGLMGQYRWRTAHWSVLVVSLDRGDTLFAEAPDSARSPASNMKILTSAAALRELGPDFRYRTYLVSQGTVRGTTLDGDLVLYGTGDPGISDRFYRGKETVFQDLADQLLAQGITTVSGDLVGDASFL